VLLEGVCCVVLNHNRVGGVVPPPPQKKVLVGGPLSIPGKELRRGFEKQKMKERVRGRR